MTIKPWNSQVTQTTTLGEQLVLMQTEIDELREVLTNVCVTLERVQKERDKLARELKTLRDSNVELTDDQLEALWNAGATSGRDCESLYFYKKVYRECKAREKTK